MKQRQMKIKAFTLVEVMVALLVVGVLLGLLLPALNMVKDKMFHVKQKAQFHTIEVGLEGFRADMGDYPASYVPYSGAPATSDGLYYGAQRLAEALIGQDGFGFHPKSLFRRDGLADMDSDGTVDDEVYHVGTDYPYESSDQNLKARKGPYIELEKANAVQLNVYGTVYDFPDAGNPEFDNFVFADMFRTMKNVRTSKLIGLPVLYYRANTSNYNHAATVVVQPTPPNVYMLGDNLNLFSLPAGKHPLTSLALGAPWWYRKTTNPAFPGDGDNNPATPPYPRPYRHDSFILHSAGADGFYGTEDDVFNFDASEN